MPSFIPKGSSKTSPSVTQELPEVTHKTKDLERRDKQDLGELSAIRELISLQEKQTELSALTANQQKTSSLPVQEPPVFSGNILDYPPVMQAFEAIMESKVDSNKDRLFFLNKYTTGKVNEAVKGFVALNTDDGYKEAKNLLAERFGNPYHIAEGYKSQLWEWPKVRDGDSSGIQALSDFLIHCKEVMKSMKYMDELNSTETLIQDSAKLPSYSGVKWCWGSHSLEECVEFMKQSVQERVAFLKSKGVCFGCLEKGHLSRSCGARLKCKKCARSHPTSLHQDSKNKQETPEETEVVSESRAAHAVSNCTSTVLGVTVINSMILPVWLHHKDRPDTEVLV